MSSERSYSLRDLIDKVKDYIELDEELNERRARDYVTRVLHERPGQGARQPYTDAVLFKLLLLLRLRQEAPKLELMDIGRIIRALPPEVVERVGTGEEDLDLPRLADPDVYARHLLGEEPVALAQVKEPDGFRLESPSTSGGERVVRQSLLPLTASRRSEDWTTIPTARRIRLQVKGELTVAQQRQLEHIAKLIDELI
jgi:hypothetical protein